MKTFMFTFGSGTPFRNKFVGVIAADASDARDGMFECFDKKWAFSYDALGKDHGVEAQIREYGITPLLFIRADRLENDSLETRLTTEDDFYQRMNVQRIDAAEEAA